MLPIETNILAHSILLVGVFERLYPTTSFEFFLSTMVLRLYILPRLTNELDQLGVINLTLQYKGRYGRNKKILNVSSKSSYLEILLNDFRLQPIEKIPFEAFIPKFKNR